MSKTRDETIVLIVGTGSIGQRHARLLGEREDTELWICDNDANCREECRRVASVDRIFENYEKALEAGPETVFVCTPHEFHRAMSIKALESGKHVFCEKPLAETAADAQTIVDAADDSGRTLQVGYVMRFHPALVRLRELVERGELGVLVGGRVVLGSYYTLTTSRNRFQNPQPNALVLDYTHEPDYLSFFFGEPERVMAEASTLGSLELVQSPNIVSMIIRYRSSALVQIHLDYVQDPGRRVVEIFGDRKAAVCDVGDGELRIHGRDGEPAKIEKFDIEHDDVMRRQHQSFLNVVRKGGTPECTGEDGANVLRIAEAAIRSTQELRSVEVASN
jgi:predicted dehydrogenase